MEMVVNKKCTIRGVSYSPGDRIDTSMFDERKLAQLLDQRYIRPADSELLEPGKSLK